MGVLSSCEELSIFETDLVRDLVDYKWETYAFRQHIWSAAFHAMYVVVLIYYINYTYLRPFETEYEDDYDWVINPITNEQDIIPDASYLYF